MASSSIFFCLFYFIFLQIRLEFFLMEIIVTLYICFLKSLEIVQSYKYACLQFLFLILVLMMGYLHGYVVYIFMILLQGSYRSGKTWKIQNFKIQVKGQGKVRISRNFFFMSYVFLLFFVVSMTTILVMFVSLPDSFIFCYNFGFEG